MTFYLFCHFPNVLIDDASCMGCCGLIFAWSLPNVVALSALSVAQVISDSFKRQVLPHSWPVTSRPMSKHSRPVGVGDSIQAGVNSLACSLVQDVFSDIVLYSAFPFFCKPHFSVPVFLSEWAVGLSSWWLSCQPPVSPARAVLACSSSLPYL